MIHGYSTPPFRGVEFLSLLLNPYLQLVLHILLGHCEALRWQPRPNRLSHVVGLRQDHDHRNVSEIQGGESEVRGSGGALRDVDAIPGEGQ